MRILMNKFGERLMSRPAGREAYLAARAYVLPSSATELTFDFNGIKVLAPSWLSEFIGLVREQYGQKVSIRFVNTDNPSVRVTIETLTKLEPITIGQSAST